MKKLTFEKRNKDILAVKTTIEYIAKTASTKQEAVNRLRDVLPNEIKLGYGSSHVWAANLSNQRLFIIENY